MKQIKIYKLHHLSIIDIPSCNNLEQNKVRIQIKATGIYRSGIHVYEGMNPMAQYPVVLGHEAAGVIIKTRADVANCQIGDHVVLEPQVACRRCYACKKGRPDVCTSMKGKPL